MACYIYLQFLRIYLITNAIVLNAQLAESAMEVSRLAITFGVTKPQQALLPSFLAQAAIAAVKKQQFVPVITPVQMEGKAYYAEHVTQDLGLTFLITNVLQKPASVSMSSSFCASSHIVYYTLFCGCTYQQ